MDNVIFVADLISYAFVGLGVSLSNKKMGGEYLND